MCSGAWPLHDDRMSYEPHYSQPHDPQRVVVVRGLPTSGAAVASLVFGIIGILGGWCMFGLPCLIAVLLGHVALGETKRGQKAGHGMAVAGLVLGYLVLVPAALISVFVVFGGIVGGAHPTPTP